MTGGMGSGSIHWDFEGGRLESARATETDTWECAIAGDTDTSGRNRSAIWFACALRGLGGRGVQVGSTDLESEWNLRPSIAWGPDTRPVLAAGRGTVPAAEREWRRFTSEEVTWSGGMPGTAGIDGTSDGTRPRLDLRFVVPEDGSGAATIAYIEPYTYADHRRFVERLLTHPVVGGSGAIRHRVLGHSTERRPIDLLTLSSLSRATDRRTGPQRTLWLVFRQHPWETYSSYAAEGLVEWLLAHAPDGGGYTWQLVPMVNVDGCARGHTRHNAIGKDPNREWNEVEPTPEVACIRKAIFDELGGRPRFFLDVHNNDQTATDYLAVSNAFAGLEQGDIADRLPAYDALIRRIAAGVAAGSHFTGTVRPPRYAAAPATGVGTGAGGALDLPANAGAKTRDPAGVAVAAAARRAGKPFDFPSALLEMRTGPLPTRGGAYGTIADQRRLGAALAESILEAIDAGR